MYPVKYRPKRLSDFDVHTETSERLKNLVEKKDFPHLMFYGPSGAGKQSRISALLVEFYGNGALKLKVETHQLKKPSGQSFEIKSVSSPFHMEIKPSEAGTQDATVVRELLKQVAQSVPIQLAEADNVFKVIVLKEADTLSLGAQQALRRTMEKYMSTCRFILCCENSSKIIEPVRSRCLGVRIPAVPEEEIKNVLTTVAAAEKLELVDELSDKIAVACEGNLRRALLMLECCKIRDPKLLPDMPVEYREWKSYIESIAKDMLEEQTPKRILDVRSKIYELLVNCIPPTIIFQELTKDLLKKLDSTMKGELIQWAAHYEYRMQCGTKSIFHLEAFIAKFMSMYKRFLDSLDFMD